MKKSLNTIAIAIALFLTLSYTFAQSPKGKYGTFALTHATVYTVTKGIINNGTVIIRNGKIEAVGTNI
ncbi:MAG: amidohydrolase, partial [Chryseotalea sp.]